MDKTNRSIMDERLIISFTHNIHIFWLKVEVKQFYIRAEHISYLRSPVWEIQLMEGS
jgi:hypothetical protein